MLSSISSRIRSFQPLTAVRTFRAFRDADRIVEPGDKNIPPYPYGARQTFKQADRGLYGGASIQFGNKIAKGRNKGKTRRTWYPNVRLETIRSEALQRKLTIRITASCMRTIKKCGGLDQYLLGEKPARIKELGLFGWKLRWKVMNSIATHRRFAHPRSVMKLPTPITTAGPGMSMKRAPSELEEEFEQVWKNDDTRTELLREQKKAWEDLREKDERFREHVKTRWEPKDKKTYSLDKHTAVPDPNLVAMFADLET